jgi:hypothetical protein
VTSGGSWLGGLAPRLASRLAGRLRKRSAADFDPPRGGSKSAAAIEIELVWAPSFAGKPPQGVEVVRSPASLLEPLLRCDVVVCTGGQTLVEAAATGTPALALEGALNQRPQIAALADREAVVAVAEDAVPATIERLLASAATRKSLSERAREAVDGRGALRVAEELRALVDG